MRSRILYLERELARTTEETEQLHHALGECQAQNSALVAKLVSQQDLLNAEMV
jgi:hypothetical protein